MKLSRFLAGLAPALAIAALIGFGGPERHRAPTTPPRRPPRPRPPPPLRRARRRRQAGAAADARLRRRRRGDRRHRQIRRRAGRPRRPDQLHALGRRHRLDADLRRARADDDHPGPRPLLRRHGPQEERRRHRDDELRHHLSGHRALRGRHLQPGVHFGRRRFIGGFSRASCRASSATSTTAASAIPIRWRRRSPRPSTCASR